MSKGKLKQVQLLEGGNKTGGKEGGGGEGGKRRCQSHSSSELLLFSREYTMKAKSGRAGTMG